MEGINGNLLINRKTIEIAPDLAFEYVVRDKMHIGEVPV